MIKVGLTGNFKSGQEEISEIFIKNNVPVFDVDLLFRFLINYDKNTIYIIKNKYGEDIYHLGLIRIEKFDTNEKMSKLINLIEPKIFTAYEKFRSKKYKYPYTVFLSSILFECGWNKKMNYVINVFNPVRKNSLIKDGMQSTLVDSILNNEMCAHVKNSISDFILHNYSYSKSSIENEMIQIHSNIIRHCKNLDYIKTF
jgi:dephospho-CoA kinase